MQFASSKECGDYFGITANAVRQRVHRNGLIGDYKIVSIPDTADKKERRKMYQKQYAMMHDRSEYFRRRYQKRKGQLK